MSTSVQNTRDLQTFVGEDVPVETWPPFPAEDILEGDPAHKGAVLYRDPTKRASYGIWECPPGKFRLDYGPMTEMIHVLSGRGSITNVETNEETRLEPGTRAIVPVGAVVIWDVKETLRKVYVAYEEEWDEHRYY